MNLFIKLFNYLFGTVKVEIKGDFAERLFNILAADRIKFWNIEKRNNVFSFYILKKDFIKLKTIRRKLKISVKIISRHGFPIVLNRYRKRYGILIGALLFFVLLHIASSHIWIIEVKCTDKVVSSEIINSLGELGVNVGIKTSHLNTDYLKQKLILSCDSLSWASLNIQGSILKVNVSEFDSDEITDNSPCNLIAKYDAVIKKINIRSGKSVVNIGNTVTKGQILVSGIKNEKGVNSFIKSDGEIFASVPDSVTLQIPKLNKEKNYLNIIKNRYVFEVMGIKIPLFLGQIKGKYDSVYTCKNLVIFGNNTPIKIHKQENYFYEEVVKKTDSDNAMNIAINNLEENLKAEGATEFKIISKNLCETNSEYTVTFDIRKTVDIANKDFFKIISEK